MKKIKLIATTLALLILCPTIFSACGDTTLAVKSISVIEDGYQTLYYADEAYQDDISILVRYENGTTSKKAVKKSMINFAVKPTSVWTDDLDDTLFTKEVTITYESKKVKLKLGFIYSETFAATELLSEHRILYDIDEQFDTEPMQIVKYRLEEHGGEKGEKTEHDCDLTCRYERKPIWISDYEYVKQNMAYTSMDMTGIYSFLLRYEDTKSSVGVGVILIVGDGLARYDYDNHETILNASITERANFILSAIGVNPNGTNEQILEGIQFAYPHFPEEILELVPPMPNTAEDLDGFYEAAANVLYEAFKEYVTDNLYMPEFYSFFDINNTPFSDNEDYVISFVYNKGISTFFTDSLTGLVYEFDKTKITCDGTTLTVSYTDAIFGEFMTVTYKLAQ